jgi:Na+/H+ antiporter NhaC
MARARPAPPEGPARSGGPGPGPALAGFLALMVGLAWGIGVHYAEAGRLTGEGLRTGLGLGYLLATLALGLALRRPLAEVSAWVRQGWASSGSLLVLLLLAWSLADVAVRLGLSRWTAELMGGAGPSGWAPALLFTASALVSLLSGTSWGTFAVFLPVAVALGQGAEPLAPALIGAVLSGGVLGDHASPLSDTTLLSAAASGCSTEAHVRTQLPYVAAAGAVALFAFVVGGVWGLSGAWIAAALGLLAALVFSRWGGVS